MNKPLTWFLLICIIFCLAACSETTIELSHVKRIMAHDAEKYTLWYSDSINSQNLQTYVVAYDCDIQIITDALPKEDMRANIYRHGRYFFSECRATLHIHSAEEINSGGGGI